MDVAIIIGVIVGDRVWVWIWVWIRFRIRVDWARIESVFNILF
jgi:hypothetical protein